MASFGQCIGRGGHSRRNEESRRRGFGYSSCGTSGQRRLGAADADFPVIDADVIELKPDMDLTQIRRAVLSVSRIPIG
ncbi:hypothetical protein L6Q21_15815 [Sandaracinobacter sp. RS1-74]|uniref:hypothetical protein n=1 Tax=Sandaracinobacteroides sayramensis TaxID=2913411 RepID=UPI001EDB8F5E|nr:hypothetical protein [Sandaracinobacteroides sayramensis]MCG2842444.1 hypothetical protein [Sandaracinobacteroides sayramensis]